jgi:hypothetical protein
MKTSVFYLSMFLLTVLVLEGLGRVAYRLHFGEGYAVKRLGNGIETLELSPVGPDFLAGQVQHPYLGAIYPARDFEINNPPRRNDKRFTVALFGGSVAFNVRRHLRSALEQHLESRGSDVDLHLALYAVPGYKQPQQLLAMAFAAATGKRMDLIINLDGYNEAVLALRENQDRGVYPFFPRLWDLQVSRDRDLAADREAVERLRERSAAMNEWLAGTGLRHSALAGFVNRVLWEHTEGRIRAITASRAQGHRPRGPEQRGPWLPIRDRDTAVASVVDTWIGSSFMMSMLAEGIGAEYFHFLQPNQYVDGSKDLNREELENAHEKAPDIDIYVDLVYPKMRAGESELSSTGVQFFDLTQIYSSTGETVYIDVCCHVNDRGNKILAEEILKRVLERTQNPILKGRESAPSGVEKSRATYSDLRSQ